MIIVPTNSMCAYTAIMLILGRVIVSYAGIGIILSLNLRGFSRNMTNFSALFNEIMQDLPNLHRKINLIFTQLAGGKV